MGESADQARQAVADTRLRMAATLERLERRLRADLDLRQRLRREGPRLAATAAIVVTVGTAVWLRRRHRPGPDAAPTTAAEWFATMPRAWQEQLQQLVEAGGGAGAADGRRPGRRSGRPLWQTAALTSARVVLPRLLAARGRSRSAGSGGQSQRSSLGGNAGRSG